MDKAVRGATKSKSAAPKRKYLTALTKASTNDIALNDMFTTLRYRLREHSWAVVFKSLIVIHTLSRESNGERVLAHIANDPTIINVSGFKDKSGSHAEQKKHIHSYAKYLEEKVVVYRDLKIDYVRQNENGDGRLRSLTVDKGLLREVKIVQRQLGALLNCKFYLDEVDNEVTLVAFRLLVKDLLALFRVVNEGVINVLEHFFEMSKYDAKDSLEIYKTFAKQTEAVVDYLNVAKKLQAALQINIPALKHAPVSLTVTLEGYLNDPNYEENKKAYELSKRNRTESQTSSKPTVKQTTTKSTTPSSSSASKPVTDKMPSDAKPSDSTKEKDLIDFDFFSAIEDRQSVITGSPYQYVGSFGRSATNPFLAVQLIQPQINQPLLLSNQPIQQAPLTLQPSAGLDSNPFRSSMYSTTSTVVSTNSSLSNPFQAVNQLPSVSPNPTNPSNPFSTLFAGSPVQSPVNQQVDSNPFRKMSVSPGFGTSPTGTSSIGQISNVAPGNGLFQNANIGQGNFPFGQGQISQQPAGNMSNGAF
ncbi:3845_t:CDS:2 [Paraglomus brasilianum]|uniref:3845_t:CDS:1 n=1 Tax=Paraglomus brasilianum TaxID=144538 RepID=A0A9N8ZEF8_9GLOM|nr:3845_t:CDS:2 [Paraglomus brasilianum]